jgi:predicted outer membrane repeat protein
VLFVWVFCLLLRGGGGVVFFMAHDGVDSANCGDAKSPCRSLKFIASRGRSFDSLTIYCSGTFLGNELAAPQLTSSFSIIGQGLNPCVFQAARDHGHGGLDIFLQISSVQVLLQGITVRGYGHSQTLYTQGAIPVAQGHWNISSCTFENNAMTAVAITQGATVSFSSCTFSGNTRLYDQQQKILSGGAISVTSANLVVDDSTFVNNRAGDNGGAIACTSSSCKIYGSSFSENSAASGSAVWNS